MHMEKPLEPEINFEKQYRLVREVIEMAVLTVLMFLIIQLAVQNYFVDGTSMEPNLHDQERILVDKWTYLFHAPARGDIIVFIAPPDPSSDYVKRIIAIPGDVITINNTTVIVDGVTLQEPYIDPKRQGNPYFNNVIHNLVVPPGKYFVLGDNRGGSSDSRDWGFVPRANIIGRAALVYWPLGEDNYGLLPNESAVFASVHQPGQQSSSRHTSGAFDSNGTLLLTSVGVVILIPQRGKRRRI
jgi:signal peptidase I